MLLQISQGNESAFGELFQSCFQSVYATALLYTKVAELAEDVVQTVFMKIWENRERLPEVENFENYLFIIARNQIINHVRKVARNETYLTHLTEQFDEEAGTPETYLLQKQTDAVLKEALTHLSPKQKKAYLLSREEGLSYEQIGEKMGISKNTVRDHIAAALQSIRSFLLQNKERLLIAMLVLRLFF